MTKSSASRAEARFKQLSCLGLGGEAVMPALLGELHALIPFFCGNFDFADVNGALANICFDNPEVVSTTPLYMQEFHNKRDGELPGNSYSDAMRTQFGVYEFATAVAVDMATFLRSDMYNLIYRKLGYEKDFLRLVVRDGVRGRGMLTLYRSPGTRPWSREDKRRLAALGPFFVHALKEHRDNDAPLVDSGRSGLIVADPNGKPVYLSPEGERLLLLATHSRIAPDTVFGRSPTLPTPLVRLCRNLSRIFSDDASASAPVFYCKNLWGGFTFRAHWLKGKEPAAGLIGITVSHEEPLPVKLVHCVESLPLSRRQAEVCVLMASGASNESIAQRLGISRHTAKEHGRWIYNKLDVHNRAELVAKLLSGQAGLSLV